MEGLRREGVRLDVSAKQQIAALDNLALLNKVKINVVFGVKKKTLLEQLTKLLQAVVYIIVYPSLLRIRIRNRILEEKKFIRKSFSELRESLF